MGIYWQSQGNGTKYTIQDYEYVDKQASMVSGKLYYRLKQFDYDGTSQLSEVRVVSFKRNRELIVYPVPTKDQLRIVVNQNDFILGYHVIDMFGRTVLDKQLQGLQQASFVDITGLRTGSYYIHVKTERGTYYKKIIKL